MKRMISAATQSAPNFGKTLARNRMIVTHLEVGPITLGKPYYTDCHEGALI